MNRLGTVTARSVTANRSPPGRSLPGRSLPGRPPPWTAPRADPGRDQHPESARTARPVRPSLTGRIAGRAAHPDGYSAFSAGRSVTAPPAEGDIDEQHRT